MGGGAVLRRAALGAHRPDAVVGVRAVSRWYVRDTRPVRRPEDPAAPHRSHARGGPLRQGRGSSRIAPTPLLRLHGDRDDDFPVEHVRSPAAAAGPAADVWLVPGMGHRQSGATAELLDRIGRWAVGAVRTAGGRGSASIRR